MVKQLLILVSFLSFGLIANAQNGLNFDGTNDYVQTNQPAITGSAARTIEAWIKVPSTIGTTQEVIVDMGAASPNGSRFTFNIINGNYLRIEVAGNGFTANTVDITDDTWHHVAVTYNPSNGTGTKAKLYIDGVMILQNDLTVAVNTASGNIRFGCRIDGANFFTGLMDEVRVWNIERTAAEIAANKDKEFCTIPTGLIAYYKFNQGTAGGTNTGLTAATNSANASFSGTLTNFSLTGASSNWVVGKTLSAGSSSSATVSSCGPYTSPTNKTYTTTGTYYDTLVSATGCDSIITTNLTIGTASPTNLAASAITSSSATISWTAVANASGYEYLVDQTPTAPTGSGTSTTNTTFNAASLNPVTTYYAHVRASCGSNFSPWVTISFTTLCATPSLTGTTAANRCGPGTLSLSATSNGSVINWFNVATGGTVQGTGSTFVTPSISATTNYWVSTSNGSSSCESARTMVTATIKPIPSVTLGNDTLICPATSATITASSATTGLSYLWSTNATTQSISVNTAGTYSVQVTKNGCSSGDTINIGIATLPSAPLMDTVKFCSGSSYTLNAGNAGSTYSWNTGATTQSIAITNGGSYRVKITNAQHCVLRDTTFAVLFALPVVDLGNDTIICQNASIDLDAQNPGASYVWSTGGNTQVINVSGPGTFAVTVTDANNCSSSDSKFVDIFDPASVDGFLFVPRFELQQGRVDFSAINPQTVTNYHWDFGDGDTSILANPSHVYTTSANYVVTLKVSNECSNDEVAQEIYVDLFLGVRSIDKASVKTNVYPIPANNVLEIEIPNVVDKIKSVYVFDIMGKELIQKQNIDKTNYQLSIGDLAAGNYMLKIITQKGTSLKRFVINR